MPEPQSAIFDRHYGDHLFLEFALGGGHDLDAVRAALRDSLALSNETTSLIVAFGPGLWRHLDHHFDFPAFSLEGKAPATQGDLFVWIQAENRSDLFDTGYAVQRLLAEPLQLQLKVQSFVYRDSRDLTGFVDGIGNPQGEAARQAAIIAEPHPAAGGSWVLSQKWVHDLEAFAALPVAEQENVFGRTKADAVEFDDERMPADAHVGRTDVAHYGVAQKIWRRSVPYTSATEEGLYFLAFSCELSRFEYLLRRMYGLVDDGVRDRLLDYTQPQTSSWWYAPTREWLAGL